MFNDDYIFKDSKISLLFDDINQYFTFENLEEFYPKKMGNKNHMKNTTTIKIVTH